MSKSITSCNQLQLAIHDNGGGTGQAEKGKNVVYICIWKPGGKNKGQTAVEKWDYFPGKVLR